MKLATSVAILLAILPAAVQGATNGNTLRCVEPDKVDYDKDYFPEKISPEFSKLWEMTYYKTYKILTNKFTDKKYALYQCGSVIPDRVREVVDDAWAVPLQDGLALSQPATVPQIEQLGVRRQIKGYIGNPYLSSPCMVTLGDEIDGDGSNIFQAFLNDTTKVDFITANPQVAILESSGAGNKTLNWNAYEENGNKATYEWHKVMGALFNLEKLANEQFDESSDRYDCVSDNAAYLEESSTSTERRLSVPTRNLAADDTKPVVLWASKIWNQTGFDVARCDPEFEYYCELAASCSSTLLHSNEGSINNIYEEGSMHMTVEEFVEFGKDADVWIIPAPLKKDFEDSWYWNHTKDFKSVQNGNVYDNQKSGGDAWFDQRTAEYDVLLQDFCDVVGLYDDTTTNHERLYFRKLYPVAEPIGNMGTCSPATLDLPWVTRASECSFVRPEDTTSSASSVKFAIGALISGFAAMLVL